MSYTVVCFDCDSTLSKIEGIDELAKLAGLGEEMARLTDAAMNGVVPLEAVYEKRLSLNTGQAKSQQGGRAWETPARPRLRPRVQNPFDGRLFSR